MDNKRRELEVRIEEYRKLLNKSIDQNDEFEEVYKLSVKLDSLVEEYICAGY